MYNLTSIFARFIGLLPVSFVDFMARALSVLAFDILRIRRRLILSNLKIAYSETINNTEIDNEYLEVFRDFVGKIKQKNDQINSDFPKYDEQKAYLEYGKVIGFEMGVNNPKIPFFSFFL